MTVISFPRVPRTAGQNRDASGCLHCKIAATIAGHLGRTLPMPSPGDEGTAEIIGALGEVIADTISAYDDPTRGHLIRELTSVIGERIAYNNRS